MGAWAGGATGRTVRNGGYGVVGDLDDLAPRASAGRAPDEATESELLEAAMEAAGHVRGARPGPVAARRRPDAVAAAPATRATSALRSVGFLMRRKGAELADRNEVASAAMGGLPHGAAATVRATTATVKVASTTAPSTSPVTPPNRRTA